MISNKYNLNIKKSHKKYMKIKYYFNRNFKKKSKKKNNLKNNLKRKKNHFKMNIIY